MVMTTSILVLVMFAYQYTPRSSENYENYQVDTKKIKFLNNLLSDTANVQQTTTTTQQSIDLPVDVSPIAENLQMYLTTYSTSSFSGVGTTWYNIAPGSGGQPEHKCTPQGDLVSRDMVFQDDPVLQQPKGIYLGSNKVSGPMSWTMGINGNGEFTLFYICQYDQLSVGATMNVFTLYGNSKNNDGLSLNILNVAKQPTQHGYFSLTFAGNTYDSNIPMIMDPNIIYIYIISKTHTSISLTQLSSVDPTPMSVLTTPLNEPDVLFSNKKMLLNGTANFNAYMKAFGTYNYSFKDTDTKNLYNYIMAEEKKLDATYQQQQQQLSQLNQQISSIKGCPFDKTTCNTCSSVTDWSKHQNIITSDATCRTAINNYCTSNNKNDYCVCWDKSNAAYNSAQCQNWRNIFQNIDPNDISNLDPSTLDQIKKQYNLKELDLTLEEDPQTGALLTLGINELPNDLTNVNIKTVSMPVSSANLPQFASVSGTQTTSTSTPAVQGTNYIQQPSTPTPSGFLSWLTSWF